MKIFFIILKSAMLICVFYLMLQLKKDIVLARKHKCENCNKMMEIIDWDILGVKTISKRNFFGVKKRYRLLHFYVTWECKECGKTFSEHSIGKIKL